jgi:hypothetical protein
MISLVLAPRLAAGGTFVSTSWSWVGDFRLRLQGCLFRCPTQPDCCRRKEGGHEPKKYGFTFERRVFCFSRERHVRSHHDGAFVLHFASKVPPRRRGAHYPLRSDKIRLLGFTTLHDSRRYAIPRCLGPSHPDTKISYIIRFQPLTNSNFNDRGELRGHQLGRQAAADFGCTCRASARPRRQRLNELD